MAKVILLLLVLYITISVVGGSHFRGAIIQWRPINPENFDGQIEITHRISWRRSYNYSECDPEAGTSPTNFFPGEGIVTCRIGCSGNIGPLSFYCTDFNTVEDWVTGEQTYSVNTSTLGLPSNKFFEASFQSGNWISTLVIGASASWEVRVKANIAVRSDGRINSSPIVTTEPIIRLQHGCDHVLRIPVEDVDGDTIRCRWAEAEQGECGGVCNAFPNSTLDMEACTLSYPANGAAGLYAVALQVEDFLDDQTPLSSVPLQFIVDVFSSLKLCGAQPILVPGETPADGSCIPVEFGTTYMAGIVAKSENLGIMGFPTSSPIGLGQSAITQSMYDLSLYFINVTWTPTLEQFGPQLFCFSATDGAGVTSERSCITLLGGVVGPRILPNSISPIGHLLPSPSTVWSMTFDQSIQRPETSHYIRLYRESDNVEVHSIDVISNDTTFPAPGSDGRILSFKIDYAFKSGESYYLLIEGGVAVGDMFCNQDSYGVTNTSFWRITAVSPFSISLINGSPRVNSSSLSVDFITSKSASSNCFLSNNTVVMRRDCSSGHVRYKNLPRGRFTFRIVSITINGERDVARRRINVGVCAVHFINDGVTTDGKNATIQFFGMGSSRTGNLRYQCSLDRSMFKYCPSPLYYVNLSAGKHFLKVKYLGCNNVFSVKFVIE